MIVKNEIRAKLEESDSFGELAILFRAPRLASVRAIVGNYFLKIILNYKRLLFLGIRLLIISKYYWSK